MSKTPRTDEEEFLARRDGEGRWMQVVESSVSRQLEAENAELREAAERWRFARDWLCVEDFDRMADEMRGHVPSEDESAKTDAACDRARALLAKVNA